MTDRPERRQGFWLITVAAVLVVSTGIALGRWQLDRAAQKEALAAQLTQRLAAPPVPEADLLAATASGDGQALWHRQVQLQGEWVATGTRFLDNRQMNGRPGFFVLTPLRLAGGQAVLVQRGWVPRDFQDRNRVPAVDTPGGRVALVGRLAPPPARLYELGEGGAGAIRQNIDLAALAQETALPLLPLSVLQTADARDGLLRDWPAPEAGVHKHYGYAFQWFGLAALFAFLYVWFQFIAPHRRRRRT